MRIAVIGAGAIGGLIAGYLTDKDEDVVLVGRPEQAAAIAQNGLSISGVRGELLVTLPVKEQLDEAVDLVILATKSQDLDQALSQNLAYIKNTRLLTVQNGIRAEELIADRLGRDNLFSSIVMFGATYLAAGKVAHNFEGNWIMGRAGGADPVALAEISKIAAKIFPAPISADIIGMKWLKLFINANNCLPAILGQSMQQAFKDIAVCKISLEIWREGWRLVNQAKIKLISLPNFPLGRLTKMMALPPEEAAKIFSDIMVNLSQEPLYGSILQSIKRGRSSEIDYINGEFVNLAVALGADAPLNARVVQMVHNIEKSHQFLKSEELIQQTKALLN